MNELLYGIVGVFVGLLMGLIFFGGLWLTVRRLPTSPNPAALVFTSFMLRTAALAPCFYLLARFGKWIGVLGGLGGLLLMRMILVGRLRQAPPARPAPMGDA